MSQYIVWWLVSTAGLMDKDIIEANAKSSLEERATVVVNARKDVYVEPDFTPCYCDTDDECARLCGGEY